MDRAHDNHIADATRDESRAPENERAHQHLAQFGVGLHEQQQLLTIELDDFTALAHTNTGERATARNHVALTGKLAGAVGRDQYFRVASRTQHANRTADDDKERDHLVSSVDEHFIAHRRTAAAMRRDSLDL